MNGKKKQGPSLTELEVEYLRLEQRPRLTQEDAERMREIEKIWEGEEWPE